MRDMRIKVARSKLADLKTIDELVDLLYKVASEKMQAQAS